MMSMSRDTSASNANDEDDASSFSNKDSNSSDERLDGSPALVVVS